MAKMPQPGEGPFRHMKKCDNPECRNGWVPSAPQCGNATPHEPHTVHEERITGRVFRHHSLLSSQCFGKPGTAQCPTCRGTGMVRK